MKLSGLLNADGLNALKGGLHYLPLILKLMEYGVVDMVLYIDVNNMVIRIILM
jgi:hypothetical protein